MLSQVWKKEAEVLQSWTPEWTKKTEELSDKNEATHFLFIHQPFSTEGSKDMAEIIEKV